MSLLKLQSLPTKDDEICESEGELSTNKTYTYRETLLQHDTVDRHEAEVHGDIETSSFQCELNEVNYFEDDRGFQFSTDMCLLKLQSLLPIDDEMCESGGKLSTSNTNIYRKTLLQQDRHEPEGMSSVDDEGTTPKQVEDEGTTPKQVDDEGKHRNKFIIQDKANHSRKFDRFMKNRTRASIMHCLYPVPSQTKNRRDILPVQISENIDPLDDVKKATIVDSGKCQLKPCVTGRPPGYENHTIELEHDLIGDLAPKQAMTPTFRKPIPTPRQQHNSHFYDEEEGSSRCCKKNEFTPIEGSLVQKAFHLIKKKDDLREEIKLQDDILKDGEQVNLLLEQKLKNAKQLAKLEINRDDLEIEIKDVRVHVQLEEYYAKNRSLLPFDRTDVPTAVTVDAHTSADPNIYIDDSGIGGSEYVPGNLSPCSESTKL